MGIAEITQGHGFKNFMKYLYGWGASIVIIGALFKLTHWPGATLMLTIGLGTEAFIFFMSALEPLHEDVDWTLVYPELAGLAGEIEVEKIDKPKKVSDGDALDKFNKMIEEAGEANLFQKFGDGIQELNGKVTQMSDISDATLATNEYSQNMREASSVVGTFSNEYKEVSSKVTSSANDLVDSYKQSGESVNYSIEGLSDSFNTISQKVKESGDGFSEAYTKLTESMDVDFSTLQSGNSEYNEKIEKLNKNLSALNAIFELQLNEADLDVMMENLQSSVENSKKYSAEIARLEKRLAALNNVYGNMLTAMNVNVND